MTRCRMIIGPLAVFDLLLGGFTLFFSGDYLRLMQPQAMHDPIYLLLRTGTLWLCFGVLEGIAFFVCWRWPEGVLSIAVIRLIEVPADLVYFFTDAGLGALGRFGLLFAPAFNLTVGILLFLWYGRFRKPPM